MKTRYLLIISSIFALSLASCGDDFIETENPIYDETATGSDPKLPAGGTGGTGGTGDPTGGGTSLVVNERQRATVTYVGATWCPPCGAYGDPTKEHMETTHQNDVIILNVQSNDAISAGGSFGHVFGSSFQSFVGSNGIPHAYWSGANFAMVHRGFFVDANANNSSADADINSILSNAPEMGVAAKATMNGDTINVETLTKFYSPAQEAFIGVYLLEDAVDALQQISGQNATITPHDNVIRGAAYEGNALGLESIGTSFSADDEEIGNYQIVIPSSVIDNTNLQVAVVVWESDQVDGISNSILVDVE